MKVIGSRSRSQDQKSAKSLFPQYETLIGNKSGSIEDRAMIKFERVQYGIFFAMAHQMV